MGDGWGESKWPERRYIRKTDLDPVSAGRPVYLEHVSGHAGTLNSEGLRLSGITRATKAPPGGEIEHGTGRRAHRRPQGHRDGPGQGRAPAPRVRRSACRPRSARAASRPRSASPRSTTPCLPLEDAETYRQADAAGTAQGAGARHPIHPQPGHRRGPRPALKALGAKTGDRTGRVTWGAVKFMCDGGMAAKTIAVTPPGPVGDQKNLGLLGWETPKLVAAMKAVRADGLADHRPRHRRPRDRPDPRCPRSRPRPRSPATTAAASCTAA